MRKTPPSYFWSRSMPNFGSRRAPCISLASSVARSNRSRLLICWPTGKRTALPLTVVGTPALSLTTTGRGQGVYSRPPSQDRLVMRLPDPVRVSGSIRQRRSRIHGTCHRTRGMNPPGVLSDPTRAGGRAASSVSCPKRSGFPEQRPTTRPVRRGSSEFLLSYVQPSRCTGPRRSCPSRRRRTSNGSRRGRSCRTSSSRRRRPMP